MIVRSSLNSVNISQLWFRIEIIKDRGRTAGVHHDGRTQRWDTSNALDSGHVEAGGRAVT
jgi:hypothetical protein